MTESQYSDSRVREWARCNGYSVGERGRLPIVIHVAFKETYPAHVLPGAEFDVPTVQACQACGTQSAWRFFSTANSICDRCLTDAATPPVAVPVAVPVVVADFPADVPSVVPETPEVKREDAPALSDATAALTAALAALTTNRAPALDVDAVRGIAREEAESAAINAVAELSQPKIVHVHVKDRETFVFEEKTHAEFENVLKLIARKRNVYLYGPPGTGKSTIAVQAAKALGLPYGDISCEPTMSATRLFGFIDANGICRSTLFKEIFTGGGIWNYEEIDNGHPGVTAAMNTALANGHCAFPDGIHAKSENFYAVATANTHGMGATRQFVGRNQLDAATLDRFVEWEIGIDEEIEEAGVLAEIADKDKGKEWLSKVRVWRANAATKNLNVIISPRGAMNGAVMLDEGFTWEQASKACIFKGMDASTRAKCEGSF